MSNDILPEQGDTVLLATGKYAEVAATYYRGPMADKIAVVIEGKDYSKCNFQMDIIKREEIKSIIGFDAEPFEEDAGAQADKDAQDDLHDGWLADIAHSSGY